MNLYELTNGMTGESYTRCYAWAASEDEARRLAVERNPAWEGMDIECKLILAAGSPPFSTRVSDCGWET